jgi:hypothetical protein
MQELLKGLLWRAMIVIGFVTALFWVILPILPEEKYPLPAFLIIAWFLVSIVFSFITIALTVAASLGIGRTRKIPPRQGVIVFCVQTFSILAPFVFRMWWLGVVGIAVLGGWLFLIKHRERMLTPTTT